MTHFRQCPSTLGLLVCEERLLKKYQLALKLLQRVIACRLAIQSDFLVNCAICDTLVA